MCGQETVQPEQQTSTQYTPKSDAQVHISIKKLSEFYIIISHYFQVQPVAFVNQIHEHTLYMGTKYVYVCTNLLTVLTTKHFPFDTTLSVLVYTSAYIHAN